MPCSTGSRSTELQPRPRQGTPAAALEKATKVVIFSFKTHYFPLTVFLLPNLHVFAFSKTLSASIALIIEDGIITDTVAKDTKSKVIGGARFM